MGSTVYNGGNNFKNSVFSADEWFAPRTASLAEIQKMLDDFSLCGRRVKEIRFIGRDFSHTRDCIENTAYRLLEGRPEAWDGNERRRLAKYSYICPELRFPCSAANRRTSAD